MRIDKLRKLKYLIEEYEELDDEADQMIEDWEHGDPGNAAMSDPSDQFVKGQEMDRKWDQIMNYIT